MKFEKKRHVDGSTQYIEMSVTSCTQRHIAMQPRQCLTDYNEFRVNKLNVTGLIRITYLKLIILGTDLDEKLSSNHENLHNRNE